MTMIYILLSLGIVWIFGWIVFLFGGADEEVEFDFENENDKQ